jgi:hypothetical protein
MVSTLNKLQLLDVVVLKDPLPMHHLRAVKLEQSSKSLRQMFTRLTLAMMTDKLTLCCPSMPVNS